MYSKVGANAPEASLCLMNPNDRSTGSDNGSEAKNEAHG